jgi:hypothetical protein
VYNETRKDALSLVALTDDLDGAIKEIVQETGEILRGGDFCSVRTRRSSFTEVKALLDAPGAPLLLVLGTGWGLTEEVLDKANIVLEPIRGVGEYNHLSVRAAAAIMLDRLRQAR